MYHLKNGNLIYRRNECRVDTTHRMPEKSRTVADVMTRNVVTVSPSHTLTEILNLKASNSSRHYVVVGSPRRLLGVISDEDVLRALAGEGNWQNLHADELMSRDVIPVGPTTDLTFATTVMQSEGFDCLPVVDDQGDVCGLLSLSDLLKIYREL
jgi:CBS domain-containing protein